jgi:cell wall assembly regulator SMI1
MASSAVESLLRLKASSRKDEDGEFLFHSFRPGISEAELLAIESKLGALLPEDVRAVAAQCGGFEGPMESISFDGQEPVQWLEEITNHCLGIAEDGFGNGWVVDCLPERERESLVLYVCHDPAVLVVQARSLAEFLDDMPKVWLKESGSIIDKVTEEISMEIYRSRPRGLTQAEALTSPDEEVAAFAKALDDRFRIFDFRDAPVGYGFCWGENGPNSTFRRHGTSRLLAMAPEAKKKNFFARLFS